MKNVEQMRELHRTRFGAEPEVFAAPGRVNLIGEHTDYAEGFVMPVAIDFATLAAVTPRSDGRVVMWAENYGEERSFDAAALPRQSSGEWSDYPVGVLRMLAEASVTIPALSLSLWGDVPLGSGLSSSASVEVATAVAALAGAALAGAAGSAPALSGPELARLCQRAENEFVGASCGIMDQFISANGKANHALLLDCRDLSYRLAPIPENVALVIANTMVRHSIAGGEYGTRRAEVELACRILAGHRREIRFLRDATMDDLARWGDEIPEAARKRARHILTENARTVAAAEALERHDMKRLGELMREAHWSYSRDFEASCAEADRMVEMAETLPGLIGARLTGGGFGGCTVNLVEQEQAVGFKAALAKLYTSETGIEPEIYICHASDGAHRVSR